MDLSRLKHQTIFDRACEHLLSMDRPSMRQYRCSYRSPDGLKCAVGIFITDEEYAPSMEGKSASAEEIRKVLGLSADSHAAHSRITLLDALQACHDLCAHSADECGEAIPGAANGDPYALEWCERMPKRLKHVADAFGLNCPSSLEAAL